MWNIDNCVIRMKHIIIVKCHISRYFVSSLILQLKISFILFDDFVLTCITFK